MARAIDSEAAYRFLSEQLVKETGAFPKGVNKGLNIARAAMRNPDAIPAFRPVSREQVERMRGEWQVCFEDWRKQIAGDQCSKCGFQHYGTSINHYHFCPACGAPMTDEAVEMVMERLEALYEQKV